MPRGVAGTGVVRQVSPTALKAWFGYKEPSIEQKKKFQEIGEYCEKVGGAILTHSAPGEMRTRALEELQIVTALAQAAIVNSGNGV